ncbi:MAG TPA: FixH family protein [Sphingomicrobium sp.]|nr:FixH family protein [Sphingomicrobium sp.]
MNGSFSGRHMTAILVAFFGVVIAVNFTMALFATRTFGGVVVENSYVASQKYNGWLDAARRQEQLGWAIEPGLDGRRRVTVAINVDGVRSQASPATRWAASRTCR